MVAGEKTQTNLLHCQEDKKVVALELWTEKSVKVYSALFNVSKIVIFMCEFVWSVRCSGSF